MRQLDSNHHKNGGTSDVANRTTTQPRPRADNLAIEAEPGYTDSQLRVADLREVCDR